MRKFRVYLDNCCYNRPYDDQARPGIELEAKAKLYIQKLIAENDVNMVSSVFLEYENDANPSSTRKKAIKNFLPLAKEHVDKREDVVSIAQEINAKGIKPIDSLHLASAIYADCDFFITTNDELLAYKDNRIRVINPTDFRNENAQHVVLLVPKESFDYTEWQKDLYKDLSVEEIFASIQSKEGAQGM